MISITAPLSHVSSSSSIGSPSPTPSPTPPDTPPPSSASPSRTPSPLTTSAIAPAIQAATAHITPPRRVVLFDRAANCNINCIIRREDHTADQGFIRYQITQESSTGRSLGYVSISDPEMISGPTYISTMQNTTISAEYPGGSVAGIGTALLQSAVQESIYAGFEGRVWLHAIGQSHGFYVKSGFAPANDEGGRILANINTIVNEAARRNERPNTTRIGTVEMHLTPEGLTRLRQVPHQ